MKSCHTCRQTRMPSELESEWQITFGSIDKNALVFPLAFNLFHDEEAKYQYHFPGPYNWKGKRRKDFYLTKGLRYHRKSRDLPLGRAGRARAGMQS